MVFTKKIYVGFYLVLAIIGSGFLFSACEEDDHTFQGPYHVRFTDTVVAIRESYPRVVKLRVHNVGPQLSEAITLKYMVKGTAREGIDYMFLGTKGTVTIPANQSFGEIQLKLINNANDRLESQDVILVLTEVTPTNLRVGFGKNNNIGRQLVLTIQDDCILSGYYIGTRRQGTTTITVPDVQVTSTDCKELTLSNWNVGLSDFFNFEAEQPTIRFIDKKDNSLEIPEQTNPFFNSSIEFLGNGSWNPQNGNITLNIKIKVPLTNPARDTIITVPTLTFIPEKN
jgi:hypothetical protein